MNKRENIKRLVKIQLIQYRSLLYLGIGFPIIFTIIFALSIADVHFHPQENTIWDIYSGIGIEGMVMGVLFGLFLGSYNLLSKDELSMFPGTVLLKYYSTVLVYHLMILAFVLEAVLMYFILDGLLVIAVHQWQELIPYGLFSWEYLWKGSLILLARCLAVYAFGLLWYALIERFRTWVICLAFVGCVGLLILVKPEAVAWLIQMYAGDDISFASYLILLLGTWVLCLFLSWVLAQEVHSWKRADKKRLISAFVILQAGLLGFGFVSFFDSIEHYSYRDEFTLEEFQQLTDHQASSLVDVSRMSKEEREDVIEFGDFIMSWKTPSEECETGIMNVFCSVSKAQKAGLDFDESGIDENHVMVLLGTQDLKYDGQDVGEKAIQSCENAIVLKQHEQEEIDETSEEEDMELHRSYSCQVSLSEKPVIVMNEAFGNLRRFLSDTTLGNGKPWDMGEGVIRGLRGVVIYPDTWNLQVSEEE